MALLPNIKFIILDFQNVILSMLSPIGIRFLKVRYLQKTIVQLFFVAESVVFLKLLNKPGIVLKD